MLYAVALSLLNPIAAAFLLVLASRLTRRPGWRRGLTSAAVLVALLGSSGPVATAVVRGIEMSYLPPADGVTADAIVILSGGERRPFPPRPTLDLNDAGDRLTYGAILFRRGAAPRVVVTGTTLADDMRTFLLQLGLPPGAVTSETQSSNTHDHAVNLCPLLAGYGISRVLLVTSAAHMPRSMAVFRRGCPALDVVPAPTDYRRPVNPDDRWPASALSLIPSPYAVVAITEALHEYVGLVYYRLRGWA